MIRPFAIAAALALMIQPAVAGKLDSGFDVGTETPEPEPAGPDEAIAQTYDACLKILERGEDGYAETETEGWILTGGPEPAGTYLTSYYAEKVLDGVGTLSIYVMAESYPSVTLGYCRLDVIAPERDIEVTAVGAVTGYEGETATDEYGVSGVWQDDADNPAVMIMANQYSGGDFFMQMTMLTPVTASTDAQ